MATFIGRTTGSTKVDDVANVNTGVLRGFTGGTVAELQDGIGDVFDAGDGTDRIFSGSGNDFIEGGANSDIIFSGAGNDTIYAMTSANRNGSSSFDTINGGAGNDLIFGSRGSESISGGDGNDTINPGVGSETLDGGAGTDTLILTDWQTAQTVNLATGVTNDQFRTAVNFERVVFGSGADTGVGTSGANSLSGGAGKDKLFGNGGKDKLNGGSGNDKLNGGKGADVLNGGGGNDKIIGGNGADTSSGGAGKDIFDFDSVAQSGTTGSTRDVIKDFQVHSGTTINDRIDLSTIDAISGGANNSFVFVTGAFSAAGQVRAVASGADTIIEVNTTGADVAEMTILLKGVSAALINELDFIL
jgi:Ca2+-binding RTX toxin-like protein